MKKNANVNTVKIKNRTLICNEIRKAPLSRAGLSKVTGLSKSALTTIIGELIADGILCETEAVNAPKGRRPILLDINAKHRFAAGINLHRKKFSALLTDIKSCVVGQTDASPANFSSGEEAVAWLCAEIRRLAEQHQIPFSDILGVGISSPGPLDHVNGVILNPPNFPLFQNMDIVSLVQHQLPLRAILENNSVLLAMNEYFYGRMKEFRNSLFVTISHGIGACVMMDGQIYRGAGGFAGELGHTSIDRNGPVCPCGNRGCVELYATLAALRRTFGFSSFRKVAEQAEQGDAFALSVLEHEAESLAAALTGAVNLLDLDSVFLYGELNARPAILLSKLTEKINERSFIARIHPVRVLASSLSGIDETSSTAAVLDRYFSQ